MTNLMYVVNSINMQVNQKKAKVGYNVTAFF